MTILPHVLAAARDQLIERFKARGFRRYPPVSPRDYALMEKVAENGLPCRLNNRCYVHVRIHGPVEADVSPMVTFEVGGEYTADAPRPAAKIEIYSIPWASVTDELIDRIAADAVRSWNALVAGGTDRDLCIAAAADAVEKVFGPGVSRTAIVEAVTAAIEDVGK